MSTSPAHCVFHAFTPIHSYQISENKSPVFYEDYQMLCHFTIMCQAARRYNITLYAVSYMINHLHKFEMARSRNSFTGFMRFTNSLFTRQYNMWANHRGNIFRQREEFACKRGGKAFRSCHNYIANNAPEKRLCDKALQYRWNFLAYSLSDHPFSDSIVNSRRSAQMVVCMSRVKRSFENGGYLPMRVLEHFKEILSPNEWEQLIDYTIITYNAIDFNATAAYYGSMENMLTAPDNNLGGEYEIKEEHEDHLAYYKMIDLVHNRHPVCNPFSMSKREKEALVLEINDNIRAPFTYMARFLQMPYEDVKRIIRSRWQMANI